MDTTQQAECVSKLELHISCRNLVNLDTFSKSDPMVVLYIKDQSGRWVEHDRTEVIKDNLNPKFVKSLHIDYRFEEIQPIKFVVVDIDDAKGSLDKQDYIGDIECKLADIVTSREQTLVRELKHNGKVRGIISVTSEEVQDLKFDVKLQFAGRHLDKKDLFGKSDPYFVISRSREGNQYLPVCKSEVIKKTLDPTWKPFTTTVQSLCNGDYDRPLLFECYDWNRSGSHELIGTFKTSLTELLSGKKEFPLIDADKQKRKKGYQNSGIIQVLQCELIKKYTFLDFIAGGCDISLIVAIDFTASNGNPMYTNSLHYNNPYEPNEYVRAITSVGSILADYDSDRKFPVYGFGAKLPPTGAVSHCFPLNGNYQDPEVFDIRGILDAYQYTLKNVQLYGPTIFSQVLKAAAHIASTGNSQQNQKYFILLIITDGVINDMDATIDQIVAANDLPLSIVIVGVGNADFENMNILDADDAPLRASNGVLAKRDIVQFVPMRQFHGVGDSSLLAKHTLEEIPAQLLSYMKDKGFVPNPPANRREKPLYPAMNQAPLPPIQQQIPQQQQIPPQQQQHIPPQNPELQSNYALFSQFGSITPNIPQPPSYQQYP